MTRNSWLSRLPDRYRARRTARLRLTVVYTALFLFAGTLLLTFTYLLVAGSPPSTKVQSGVVIPAGEQTPSVTAEQKCAATVLDRAKYKQCVAAFDAGLKTGVIDQRAAALDSLLLYSALGLGLMTVLSAGLCWTVAGRVLRPIHAITGAAQRAGQENLGERIALSGPRDELKELADTFDAMLGRLERAFNGQRRFVANASHELRTPLSVMRTAVDVTLAKPERSVAQLEEMAAEVGHEITHAERLIEALLTMARSDGGIAAREPTDLATLAEDALDASATATSAAQLRVESALDEAWTSGDPVLLGRVAANLVENAARYNVPGGLLRLTTGALADSGQSFIEVANDGPSVPADQVSALFEPFRRLDDRRGHPAGAGLGLAIVQSVAAAHGGRATARSRPGGGLIVTVTLPTYDRQAS
jgi:signal transduction histidine kinase